MKTITVTTQNPHILQSSRSILAANGTKAVITSKEGWQIVTECREEDKTDDREMTQIKIYMPGNKVFTGTMQDINTIHTVLKNAHKSLFEYSGQSFDDKKKESEVLDITQEVAHLLNLFS